MDVTAGIGMAVTFILGLFGQHYLPSYLAKKGENLATKDDVAEITRLVKAAEQDYLKELERFRGAVSVRLGMSQFRYQREYDLLVELAIHLVEVRDAALDFREPYLALPPGTDPEVDRRKSERYRNAVARLKVFQEPKRPFLPVDVRLKVLALLGASTFEHLDYTIGRTQTGAGVSTDHSGHDTIKQRANAALDAIEKRSREWEAWDGGPAA